MVGPNGQKGFEADPGNEKGNSVEYGCSPTKYIPIKDHVNPREAQASQCTVHTDSQGHAHISQVVELKVGTS